MKVIFSLIAGSFLMLGLVGCGNDDVNDGYGLMATSDYILPPLLIEEIVANSGDGEYVVSATATDNGSASPSIEFNLGQ